MAKIELIKQDITHRFTARSLSAVTRGAKRRVRLRATRWIGGAISMLVLLTGVPARADTSSKGAAVEAETAEQAERAERAEELFQSGTRAFEATQYRKAIEHLQASFELFPTYRAACGLGQVELHLSHYRAAAEHLDYCVRNYPVGGGTSTQQRILTGLGEARRRVFALGFRANVRGAELRIDGKLVAKAPVAQDIFVDPGEHKLEVSKPGYAPVTETSFFPSGGQRDWVVELRAPSTSEQRTASAAPGYVLASGAALSGVLLSAGILLHDSARSASREARALQEGLSEDASCADDPNQPACLRLRSAFDAELLRVRLGNGALIASAASALITGIIYAVILPSDAPTKEGAVSRLRVGADVGTSRAAFTLGGQF